jgi:RNA polymerase sigma-70 factor (ECF subfamily)
MYLPLTDEALMSRLKDNDQLALETLFNRYYKSLCQFCAVYTNNMEAAEEIIADLFIKLWDNRNTVTILHVKGYLFISAKNLSLNFIHKKKAPVDLLEDISTTQPEVPDGNTPFKIMSGKESYNHIMTVIDTLPHCQRQVLLMSRIDNLDKHEIAAVLGISVRTVETTLYQAIKKLRSLPALNNLLT